MVLDVNRIVVYRCTRCSFHHEHRDTVVQHFITFHYRYCQCCVDTQSSSNSNVRRTFRQHIRKHVGKSYMCELCRVLMVNKYMFRKHVCANMDPQHLQEDAAVFQRGASATAFDSVDTALDDSVKVFSTNFPPERYLELQEVLQDYKYQIMRTIRDNMNRTSETKLYLEVRTHAVKPTSLDPDNEKSIFFRSFALRIMRANQESIHTNVRTLFNHLETQLHNHSFNGSGWVIMYLTHLNVCIADPEIVGNGKQPYYKFSPHLHPPPAKINRNPQNMDLYRVRPENTDTTWMEDFTPPKCIPPLNKRERKSLLIFPSRFSWCFFAAVASFLYPEFQDTMEGLRKLVIWIDSFIKNGGFVIRRAWTQGMSVSDIPNFLKANKHRKLRINVFHRVGVGKIFPVYTTPHHHPSMRKATIVNLLLVYQRSTYYHFIPIRNVNLLLRNPRNKWRIHVCCHCVQSFATENGLKAHEIQCSIASIDKKVILPKPNSVLCFKAHQALLYSPFLATCDFESVLQPPTSQDSIVTGGTTQILHVHRPVIFALSVVDWNGQVIFHHSEYDSENVMPKFFKLLDHLYNELRPALQKYPNTPEIDLPTRRMLQNQKNCCICLKTLDHHSNDAQLRSVIHHFHHSNQ